MKKLVLAIAFIGIGSFAMAQQTEPKKLSPEQKQEMMAKRAEMKEKRMAQMKTELNLTDKQVSEIKVLQERRMAENKAQMEKNRAERKAKNKQMNDDMKKILSSEQYAKWESNKKMKMEKRHEMMKGKKGMDRKMMNKNMPEKASL